jgi:hypothetical protein
MIVNFFKIIFRSLFLCVQYKSVCVSPDPNPYLEFILLGPDLDLDLQQNCVDPKQCIFLMKLLSSVSFTRKNY